MVSKFPHIISDFSELINFNFEEVYSYFNQKIYPFESEYYFLINSNSSLLVPNNKLGINNKIIDEIINIAFDLKIKHPSSKVKIFSYKKYVKEISEINEDDDTEMDRERISELLLKEIDESPKSDILTSLSNLYTKIHKPLNNEINFKKKIIKIIIVNNEMAKYKNIHEKIFSDEKLIAVLNEFINEKSNYFGIEIKILDDRLHTQHRKGFEKISDFPTGQLDIINNEVKDENLKIIKSIYLSDDLLKKAEKLGMNLYKIWKEISENDSLNKGIEKLDEIVKFYEDVLNSIFTMKYKISKSSKNSQYKDKCVKKINNYISIDNLNNVKNEIFQYEESESFMQEISDYQDQIKKINLDSFIKKLNDNKRFNNCICWNKIVNYLLTQKKYINKYLDILHSSKTLIELLEKEIINKGREIINNDIEEDDKEDDREEVEEENENNND